MESNPKNIHTLDFVKKVKTKKLPSFHWGGGMLQRKLSSCEPLILPYNNLALITDLKFHALFKILIKQQFVFVYV